MTVIVFPFEIFRRSNSLVTAVYAQDIVRTVISNDWIPKTRKTRSLAELAKDNRTFLPVRDFSSFKLPSYCILRAWHSARCIKLRLMLNNSQNAIIRRFQRNMTVIFFPSEIFRHLNSLVTAFYAHDILPTVISNDRIPKTRKTRSLAELAKINRTFLPVRDFSSFKLPRYCILRAEHSACCSKRRNKTTSSQNAIIRRF
jgi:hypothetical protein